MTPSIFRTTDEDLKKYFNRKDILKATPNTIIDIGKMNEQLAAIRQEGVAFEYGECVPFMNGIASGIKNSYGETIGAVFLMGDSKRFTREVLLKLEYSLKIYAENISRESGYI